MITTPGPPERLHEAVPGDHRVGRREEGGAARGPRVPAGERGREHHGDHRDVGRHRQPHLRFRSQRGEDAPGHDADDNDDDEHADRERDRAPAGRSRSRRCSRRAPTRNAASPATNRSCGKHQQHVAREQNTSATTNHARRLPAPAAGSSSTPPTSNAVSVAGLHTYSRTPLLARARDPVADREHAPRPERHCSGRVHGASRSRTQRRRPAGGNARGRAAGRDGPATTRVRRRRRRTRPRTAATADRSRRSRPRLPRRARQLGSRSTTRLCGDAHAPIRWPAGPGRPVAPPPRRRRAGVTGPVTRTCRSCSRQWNTSAARGFAASCARLGALEVRVEREAPLVEAAHEHRARRDLAVGRRRRERHRLGLAHTGRARFVEPALELDDRVGSTDSG